MVEIEENKPEFITMKEARRKIRVDLINFILRASFYLSSDEAQRLSESEVKILPEIIGIIFGDSLRVTI